MRDNGPRRQRWFLWLDQLRAAGAKGVVASKAVVRDPDRCTKVLTDKGYEINYRIEAGQTRYIFVAEPVPYVPKETSTFPGEVPDVGDNQETLF